MVARHQRHGVAAQHPRAVEPAPAEQHLREREVIGRRRHAAGAAGVVLGWLRDVDQRDGGAGDRVLVEGLSQARHLRRRHREAGIVHLQRLEHARLEELAERCARGRLHHAPQHVDGHAVLPHAPRLLRERRLGQAIDVFHRRHVTLVERLGFRIVEARFDVRLLHRRVRRDLVVREAGGVTQEILDGRLTLGRYQRVGELRVCGVGPGHAHHQVLHGREELRDRIGELDLAVLHQDHRGDRRQRLGHRVDPKDGVVRHRRSRGLVARPDTLEVGDLPLARDDDDGARELSLVHLALECRRDVGQTLR